MNIKRRPGWVALSLLASSALVLSACGGDDDNGGGTDGGDLSGEVVIDGSSTVEPLSSAAAELFMGEHNDVAVTVSFSGTGGGFKKFCAGETDISDASRPIKDEEIQLCEQNGIEYSELQIANDALTVVVNPDNDWADCLTVEQLNTIWAEDSTVDNWNQVDPSFPDEPLELHGPGPDSGTFDYFTGEVNGEEGVSRTDYNPSEDDNVIVAGVEAAKGALGYFGFSYFLENQDNLKAVEIDGGDGCVAPSLDAAQDGSYSPLARPLFIYASDTALAKEQVVAFCEFYLENNDEIVEAVNFVPMTDEQKTAAKASLDELKAKVGS